MKEERSLSTTHLEQYRTISAKLGLFESLVEEEYRRAFVSERVRASVALQIQAMRAQRDGMTQTELGKRLGGKAQPWVSRLEDPEYGKVTVTTLLEVADAFDVDLEIKFRPFSKALNDLAAQGPDYWSMPSFTEELSDIKRSVVDSILDATTIVREQSYKVEIPPGTPLSPRSSGDSLMILDAPIVDETRANHVRSVAA